MEQSAAPTAGSRLQHIGEVLLVIVGAYLLAGVAVSILNPLVTRYLVPLAATNVSQIALTVIQFGAMVVVIAWYVRFIGTERLIRAVVPGRRGVALIVGGTVVLLGGQYAINQLLQWANLSPGANQAVLAGSGDPTYFLAMAVVSILVVGPAEELLFRGAVQGRLRESWGSWPAIIAATVLFGLVHIPAVTGGFEAQLSYALVAGVLGVVLGYLYEYTNNLVVPAVTHGCYNASLFFLLYLSEIGVGG